MLSNLPPKTPRKVRARKVEFKSDDDESVEEIAPNQLASRSKPRPVRGEKRGQEGENEPKKKKQKT